MKLLCPNCSGTNIAQFKMLTGKIWCEDCKFTVENKEVYNPFLSTENYEEQFIKVAILHHYNGKHKDSLDYYKRYSKWLEKKLEEAEHKE